MRRCNFFYLSMSYSLYIMNFFCSRTYYYYGQKFSRRVLCEDRTLFCYSIHLVGFYSMKTGWLEASGTSFFYVGVGNRLFNEIQNVTDSRRDSVIVILRPISGNPQFFFFFFGGGGGGEGAGVILSALPCSFNL